MSPIELHSEPYMSWMKAETGERAAVISDHIRLSRNFRRFPFPVRAQENQLTAVVEQVLSLLPEMAGVLGGEPYCLYIDQLSPTERELLIDAGLLTVALCRQPEHRLAIVGRDRRVSILVNENEHLQIHVSGSGLDLAEVSGKVNELDDLIESKIDFAFDSKLGYLTSCPTELGTGMRASVILHLPALAFAQEIDNIVGTVQQMGLAMPPMFVGKKQKQQYGSVFRLSHRSTLGVAEREILDTLQGAVQEIIKLEMRAREALREHRGSQLEDMVWRAFGVLRYARLLGEGEALDLFSKVRLGVDMGIIAGLRADFFGEALLSCQESFLKYKAERESLSTNEAEKWRGTVARQLLHRYIKPKPEKTEGEQK